MALYGHQLQFEVSLGDQSHCRTTEQTMAVSIVSSSARLQLSATICLPERYYTEVLGALTEQAEPLFSLLLQVRKAIQPALPIPPWILGYEPRASTPNTSLDPGLCTFHFCWRFRPENPDIFPWDGSEEPSSPWPDPPSHFPQSFLQIRHVPLLTDPHPHHSR